MPLSELLFHRACPALIDGLCPGHGGPHCKIPHSYESGCSAGWCAEMEQRVGACGIWLGEKILPYEEVANE